MRRLGWALESGWYLEGQVRTVILDVFINTQVLMVPGFGATMEDLTGIR